MKIKSHRECTSGVKEVIVSVLICTLGLMLCCADEALATSVKDTKKQTLAPSSTQTPSKTAPLQGIRPAPTATKKFDPTFIKDVQVSHFTTSKTYFQTGDYVRFSFRIHNNGNVILAQIPFGIYFTTNILGPYVKLVEGTLNYLRPGTYQSIERQIPITYQALKENYPGAQEYRGIVLVWPDPSHAISELNPGHVSSIDVTFRQRWVDLAVAELVVRGSPRTGEYFDVDYTIKNKGDVVSTQLSNYAKFWLSSYITGYNARQRTYVIKEHRFTAPPLGASRTATGKIRLQMPDPPNPYLSQDQQLQGFFGHIELSVDSRPDLQERNHENDTGRLDFFMTPSGEITWQKKRITH